MTILSTLLTYLRSWPERFDIGRLGSTYLTRWTLLGRRYGGRYRLFLHLFHRSDADALHDHPWSFWSLIVWGGYYERTPSGVRWRGPGSLAWRPATWRHQVVLPPGRRCWSLVLAGPKRRSWGFWCPQGWRPWRKHALAEAATGDGCGET